MTKEINLKKLTSVLIASALLAGCSKVPAGYVGIKVYLLGSSKGVDSEALGVGRYWIGVNENLYLYPTFQQNYTWTKDIEEGVSQDESFTFQTSEGMQVGADIGISYHLDPDSVPKIFQKYRKGINEITNVYLRNHVRDALNKVSSTMRVEDLYGKKKSEFMENVVHLVKNKVSDIGISIDEIYLIGSFRLPQTVVIALNRKLEATQMAQQRQNEVAQARAEADKKIENARGEAESILTVAKAQADANRILAQSLTPNLVKYKQIERWNGVLPKITGNKSVAPMLDFRGE